MTMKRVFEVRGPAGTIDGVQTAFDNKVEALSADPRVLKIDARIESDGIRETVLGPQVNVTGYTIDVEMEIAA